MGRVLVGGRDLHTMASGRDGTWTPDIRRRPAELGIRTTLRLENHVEMKVAQLMIQLGERDGQVVINHAPCGSQRPMRSGCHQVLARYLPQGYTLTVYGTTRDGLPFSHTYEGRA
ncbi:MAG TPA: DddA-like double-stranded DNA deaminase toxin [Pseudonocardiaceae bacterium]|nr:DddA-like double-stranded DNA deaminase toxin [Pseudonocardiaceae bacterium]